MLAAHLSPAAVRATSTGAAPPRVDHVSVAPLRPGGGHALAVAGCDVKEIWKPSRAGAVRPSATAGFDKPCGPNAASMMHWSGVPLDRSPSSSSTSSAAAYDDGMSEARWT